LDEHGPGDPCGAEHRDEATAAGAAQDRADS